MRQLYKNGDKQGIVNYRPISILNVWKNYTFTVSKLFWEKLIIFIYNNNNNNIQHL